MNNEDLAGFIKVDLYDKKRNDKTKCKISNIFMKYSIKIMIFFYFIKIFNFNIFKNILYFIEIKLICK